MPARGEASGWERVLVRHIVSAARTDIHRLWSLVHAPFGNAVLSMFNSGADLSLPPPPSGRWMIAARFAKESWLSLFSGAAGQELFDANAGSRRMEVAWVGCQPEGVGWFVRVNRAAKPVVEFAKGVQKGATPTLHSTAIEPDFLRDGETGEQSFRQVCTRFEVSIPAHEVRATDRGFAVVGANGRPVKSALRGFILAVAPAISAGENAAADALAEAIDLFDVDGIGGAINRGAPIDRAARHFHHVAAAFGPLQVRQVRPSDLGSLPKTAPSRWLPHQRNSARQPTDPRLCPDLHPRPCGPEDGRVPRGAWRRRQRDEPSGRDRTLPVGRRWENLDRSIPVETWCRPQHQIKQWAFDHRMAALEARRDLWSGGRFAVRRVVESVDGFVE